MNRIKELRERKGLSQEDLARAVRTSQPQIQRLESGRRPLTEDWMRRIATVLDVRPADLLTTATIAEFEDELEPFFPDALADLAKPLKARNLAYYRVKSSRLDLAGVRNERVILVDQSKAAIEARKIGDILMLQLSAGDGKPRVVRVLRQFIPPRLLTTNHGGTNTSFALDATEFRVEIKGIMQEG